MKQATQKLANICDYLIFVPVLTSQIFFVGYKFTKIGKRGITVLCATLHTCDWYQAKIRTFVALVNLFWKQLIGDLEMCLAILLLTIGELVKFDVYTWFST